MNKLAVPTIMAATVLVAGMFAFMPVERASSVHSGIINEALTVKTVVNTSVMTLDAFGGGIILDVTCDKDFVVTSFRVATTHDNALDDFSVFGPVNGGLSFDAHIILDPPANVDVNNDLISDIGTNVGVRGGTNFEVDVLQSGTLGAADFIAVGDADVTILAPTSAICTVTGHPGT